MGTLPSFNLANWFEKNKKSILIAVIGVVALMLLLIAAKFVYALDFNKNAGNNKTSTAVADTTNAQSTTSYIPKPLVPITKAGTVYAKGDESKAPAGGHPLIDMYCGALGNKGITLYLTFVDTPSKRVSGYSVVGNSRTDFEGIYTEEERKKPSNQADNYIDYGSTIYKLILQEPNQSNKNGVFNLQLDISDLSRTGYGSWVSYDGMLYREIKIIDRLNE